MDNTRDGYKAACSDMIRVDTWYLEDIKADNLPHTAQYLVAKLFRIRRLVEKQRLAGWINGNWLRVGGMVPVPIWPHDTCHDTCRGGVSSSEDRERADLRNRHWATDRTSDFTPRNIHGSTRSSPRPLITALFVAASKFTVRSAPRATRSAESPTAHWSATS